jgi:hypothetical protein
LLRKCAKTGLIKIKRINSRNVQYILTPSGLKEITKKTINYVRRSYKAIVQIQETIKDIAQKKVEQGKSIILLCNQDEVYQLVTETLHNIRINYMHYPTIEEIPEDDNMFLIYWDPKYDTVNNIDIESFNLFQSKEKQLKKMVNNDYDSRRH